MAHSDGNAHSVEVKPDRVAYTEQVRATCYLLA